MYCNFTDLEDPQHVTASDEVELQNVINSAGSAVVQVDVLNNISLTQSIQVPSGSRLIIHGVAAGATINSAAPNTFQLFTIHSSSTTNTIFQISNLRLMGGGGSINGGAIGANETGNVEVVLDVDSNIQSCQAPNGGAVFVLEGGIRVVGAAVSQCNASVDGGALYASCVELHTANVSHNVAARNGGAIYALEYSHINSSVTENSAGGDGGGVYLIGDGLLDGFPDDSAILSFNTAGGSGGGIYLSNSGAMTTYLVLQSGVRVEDNKAILDGGGVWVSHGQLARLHVGNTVTFQNNLAQNSVPNRLAIDDAVYLTNILSTTWTSPFTQGYNNYDIAYAPPIPCNVTGERLLDIALPVRVRPFATVGDVVSRCCGTATIVPEYQDFPPDEPNCDFTIHQRVCVQVPVEFGAAVEPGRVHSECTGESCEECEESDENNG